MVNDGTKFSVGTPNVIGAQVDAKVLKHLKSDKVIVFKKKRRKEFRYIKEIMDFDKKSHEIFRNWYIDGRLYYLKVIDEKASKGSRVKFELSKDGSKSRVFKSSKNKVES
jgi:hypothetical protein